MTVALRSAKRVCRDRTSPLARGTAAQTSGTPSSYSSTWVARRLSWIRLRRLAGSDGSLILAPNFGDGFFVFVASYSRWANSSRSS